MKVLKILKRKRKDIKDVQPKMNPVDEVATKILEARSLMYHGMYGGTSRTTKK